MAFMRTDLIKIATTNLSMARPQRSLLWMLSFPRVSAYLKAVLRSEAYKNLGLFDIKPRGDSHRAGRGHDQRMVFLDCPLDQTRKNAFAHHASPRVSCGGILSRAPRIRYGVHAPLDWRDRGERENSLAVRDPLESGRGRQPAGSCVRQTNKRSETRRDPWLGGWRT
jgi:hypothetical protein